MSKINEIIEGWKNVVFPNNYTENVAYNRASICGRCEHYDKGKCKKCGCNLVAKTRSMKAECPINKW